MVSKTHFIGIFALAYLIVSGGVLGFVLYEVYASGNELEEKVALIAETNAKIKLSTDLSRLIAETKNERAELDSYVLTEDKTSTFLTEIEALGSMLGVSLATLGLNVVNNEGSFDSLAIEFEVNGAEHAVKKMLALFETLPYHSRVETLRLTQEKNGTVAGTVVLSVTLLKHDQ